LQIEPNDSLIAIELARRMQTSGRLEEAHKVMKSVVAIDYRFETVHLLAQIEYQSEKIDESFRHLNEALLIAPEGERTLFDVFKTLGNIFVRRGDLDSAEDSYNRAHRLNPHSDVLNVNFGTLMIQRQDWDAALARFRQALEINPRNDKAWVGLALGHRMKGDWELAWGNIEAALSDNPLNDVALGLALEWSSAEGREFRALELIRGFLVKGGWSEKMSLAFVWLSWRRGDMTQARLELERLLAVNPANTQALNMIHEMRGEA
jgi:tetratricopeptide (TPR) repeat protein